MLVLGRSLQNITKQQSLYCIILSEKKRHDEEREREREGGMRRAVRLLLRTEDCSVFVSLFLISVSRPVTGDTPCWWW